jgi:anhydro-N-acetylmuramic acid kinase
MAVGGQGAPLVPWTDYVLFHDKRKSRVIQNIGGIANLTYLPAACDVTDVIAFDTGPGNMVIDELVRHFSRGNQQFDRDGRIASRGTAHPVLDKWMFDHSFFATPVPRTCGREQFGGQWVESLLRRFASKKIPAADWIRTATELTANSIFFAATIFLAPSRRARMPPIDQLILCGGGAKNQTLVSMLRFYFSLVDEYSHLEFLTTDEFGISTQAKEGVSFAMLAAARIDRVPANLPRVTGAKRPVLLGDICDLGLK